MVWKEFIERDPSVKNYRDKVISYYRDLDISVGKDYVTGAEAGTKNDETSIPQKGFKVDNEGVESVYSIINERTLNRVSSSSSTTPGASTPFTGSLASKKNRVHHENLDRDDGVIEKLALAADKLEENVGQSDLAVMEKELKEIPTLSKDDLIKALFYYRDNDDAARGFLVVSQDSKKDYLQYEMKNIQ
ncbi:hypothetical protein GIB67_039028 [Kingdonia uniflora]|uniref:Uncharacterized protein n=1 Tax=Kingdonia uniflora TaxID=39325 RepID=A0A7J7LKQ3_9MAGN|nr:hypothetical protein GIB67_039028 [Kingdonia uniflora]